MEIKNAKLQRALAERGLSDVCLWKDEYGISLYCKTLETQRMVDNGPDNGDTLFYVSRFNELSIEGWINAILEKLGMTDNLTEGKTMKGIKENIRGTEAAIQEFLGYVNRLNYDITTDVYDDYIDDVRCTCVRCNGLNAMLTGNITQNTYKLMEKYPDVAIESVVDDNALNMYDRIFCFALAKEYYKESVTSKKLKEDVEGVAWSEFDKFSDILAQYLPDRGEGETKATQVATAISKLVYKWYNDGDVYDNRYALDGWANDLSSYANWLDEYILEAPGILRDIKHVTTENSYEQLLYRLCSAVVVPEKLENWNTEAKVGSVYDCSGPFEFRERITCQNCGIEIDEYEESRYCGLCYDCYQDQYESEDEEDEDL